MVWWLEESIPSPATGVAPLGAQLSYDWGPGSPQAAVGWDQAECFACWEQGCLRSLPWWEECPGGDKQADSCDSESCYMAAKPCWGCSGHLWVAGHPQPPPHVFGETWGNQAEQSCSAAGAMPGLGSSPKSGNLLVVSCPVGLSGFTFQPCPCPQVL